MSWCVALCIHYSVSRAPIASNTFLVLLSHFVSSHANASNEIFMKHWCSDDDLRFGNKSMARAATTTIIMRNHVNRIQKLEIDRLCDSQTARRHKRRANANSNYDFIVSPSSSCEIEWIIMNIVCEIHVANERQREWARWHTIDDDNRHATHSKRVFLVSNGIRSISSI